MADRTQRLTKRQQRLAEKGNQQNRVVSINKTNLELERIVPKTHNQSKVFDSYETGQNLCLHGCAGTGKTFLTMFLALREILSGRSTMRKLIIIRSAQPSKQIGFLPGKQEEKIAVYEAPYANICVELFNRGDAYQVLKQRGLIEFDCTSFLRGTTIDNAIILLDESQNLSYQELRTVMTRVGENSRLIVSGDTKQDDLTSERFKEVSGLGQVMKIFESMSYIDTIQFDIEDIVRSGFVKDFIVAEHELGY